MFQTLAAYPDLPSRVAKQPHGPSIKFLVENGLSPHCFDLVLQFIVHTMDELKLTGNCLKGSRPILNFDSQFDTQPHYKLIKELFFQVSPSLCVIISISTARYVFRKSLLRYLSRACYISAVLTTLLCEFSPKSSFSAC